MPGSSSLECIWHVGWAAYIISRLTRVIWQENPDSHQPDYYITTFWSVSQSVSEPVKTTTSPLSGSDKREGRKGRKINNSVIVTCIVTT